MYCVLVTHPRGDAIPSNVGFCRANQDHSPDLRGTAMPDSIKCAVAMFVALSTCVGQLYTAEVRELTGQIFALGKTDRDRQPVKGVLVTVRETQDNAITNDNGLFTIKFVKPLRSGQTIVVMLDKVDLVIIYPDFFGRFRLPDNSDSIVEFWVVPKGSRFILADQQLQR